MPKQNLQAGALSGLPNNTAQHWWKDPGLLKLHFILFAYFMCYITSGFDNSLINNLQSLATFLTVMDNPSASALGVIGAIVTIGGLIGCYPGSFVADRWGRRFALTFGSSISAVGIFVQTFANNPIMYGAGRFIVGFGNLAVVAGGAAYVNEMAHPRYRLRITCFYQVIWYVGAIIASWTCYGMKVHHSSTWQWRLPTLLQIAFSIWTFSLIFWTPESPRWLISKGRMEEASEILFKYHANGDYEDEMVKAEIEEMKETHQASLRNKQGEASWATAFKGKANQKRMFLVALFATAGNWTSQSIVTSYNTEILKQAGITSSLQQLEFNGGLSIVDLVCAACGAVLSWYIGRRTLLLIGFGGMGIAHVIVTVLASQYAKYGEAKVGYAVIAFIWVESSMYNIGLNPVGYNYVSEIMSNSLRAKGLVWYLFVTYINAIIARYVNPIGLANLGYWYYVVYCFFYVFWIAAVYFFFPETRNKTLEEIEAEIDGVELKAAVEARGGEDIEKIVLGSISKEQDDRKEP